MGRLKRLAGRSRIQVNRLADAVATQNMKKSIVWPTPRVIGIDGKVMSRSMSGSTKAKNTIVATPAAKKLGHRIAPTRCAIGRGGWSKRGSVKSVTGWLSPARRRSEEHTSELQSLMRSSYDVFCLKKKQKTEEYTQ